MSHVVVTGAAGFIGSHVCERLIADSSRVVGIDAFRPTYARAQKVRNLASLAREERFTLIDAGLDGDDLRRALKGASAIVHLAGLAGVRGTDPVPYAIDNVRATAAVLAAAVEANVPRVVLASSSSVYEPAAGSVSERATLAPISLYGESKLQAERLAHGAPLHVVILRYFSVYGPRQRPEMAFARFVDAAATGVAAPLYGDGSQVRDFTFIDDAVDATARAITHGRDGVYNVGGGCPASLTEALATLAAALGRPIPVRAHESSALEPRSTHADISRARADLGWRPLVTLTEGIAAQVRSAVEP